LHGNLFHAETRRRGEKIAEKRDRKNLRDLFSASPRLRVKRLSSPELRRLQVLQLRMTGCYNPAHAD